MWEIVERAEERGLRSRSRAEHVKMNHSHSFSKTGLLPFEEKECKEQEDDRKVNQGTGHAPLYNLCLFSFSCAIKLNLTST